MRRLAAALVLIGCAIPVASVSAWSGASSAIAPAVDECPYGPASSPTVGVSTGTVNPGGAVTLTGSGFTKSSTVRMTISPGVPTFPRNLTSDSTGKVTLAFTAPSTPQTYTITLTDLLTGVTAASESTCGGVAQTTLTVADVGSGGPTTTTVSGGPTTTTTGSGGGGGGGGGGTGTGGGSIPATGSDVAPLLQTALVLVLAGAGLGLVGITRRRRSA
jgi:hypothetical protein